MNKMQPTNIQSLAIPKLINGRDVYGGVCGSHIYTDKFILVNLVFMLFLLRFSLIHISRMYL